LADLVQLAADFADNAAASGITPVSNHPLIAKYLPWMIDTVIRHPERDQTWTELSALDKVSSITSPALHIGGWYDHILW
jgi:predicted acyl esterase